MTLFDDRLRLAREIADRLLEEHGDVIVAIGLHGSMAHRAIDERSDLDFAIVTRGPDDLRGRDVLFGDVLLSLSTDGADDYLAEAAEIDEMWPIKADQYVSTLVLHDPDGFFERLKQMHERAVQQAGDEGFADLVRENVVCTLECLGKAERCLDHDSPAAADVAFVDSLTSLARAVGMLTRTRWRGPHTAVAEANSVGSHISGFAAAYERAADGRLDARSRIAALRDACGAVDRHLESSGVSIRVDSLARLLG